MASAGFVRVERHLAPRPLTNPLHLWRYFIYADNHNSAVQRPTNGEVNDRLRSQQERIGNGVKQGDLTGTQTAKLETQETGINKEETGMREQDNGKLTAADRKTMNKQLTQERRRISRDERHTERRK